MDDHTEKGIELTPLTISMAQKVLERELNAPWGRIEWMPVGALIMDGARRNDKRPAWLKVAVPDGYFTNLSGAPELLDQFLLVRIPRETVEWVKKETEGEAESSPTDASPADEK